MKKILLTQNQLALVDNADYEWLCQYKWQALKAKYTFYAQRHIKIDGRCTSVSMHRVILGLKFGDGKEIDHIDGNGLNNQRSNLRICSRSENNDNRPCRWKGFYRRNTDGKFIARIQLRGKRKWLGSFTFWPDAQKAYNLAAQPEIEKIAKEKWEAERKQSKQSKQKGV